jgi:hypothetical protein
MKIKRGLRRVWVLGTFAWGGILAMIASQDGFDAAQRLSFMGIGGLIIWWAIYWGISGFFSDE